MNAWVPEGRTIRRVKVPRQDGTRVERSTGTRDPNTARKIGLMVEELGRKGQRAWDILDRVTASPPKLALEQLWDWWVADNRDLSKIRSRLADEDLALRIPAWRKAVLLEAGDDTAAHYEHAVRTLADKDGEIRLSRLTTERLIAWLADLTVTRYELVKGKRTAKQVPLATGTKRKYFMALVSFFGYLRTIKVVKVDLLEGVPTPAAGAPRDRHLETPEVLQLVGALEEPHRTIAAIAAGTGIELSVILALRGADFDMRNREVRARGKKTERHGTWRDRIVRVATWAWPFVEAYLEGRSRKELLFAGTDRWRHADAHHAACRLLEIRDYAPRDHRHTWAVRLIKSGASIEEIVRQGGWKDGVMLLRVYSRHFPKQKDRDRLEKLAAAMDQEALNEAESGSHSGSQRGDL